MRTTIEFYFTLFINSLFTVVSHLHKRQLDQALRALGNIQSTAPRKLAELVLGGSEFLLLLVHPSPNVNSEQVCLRFSGILDFVGHNENSVKFCYPYKVSFFCYDRKTST